MTSELLEVEDAARRYDIPMRELVMAYYYRTLPTVKVEGGLPRVSVATMDEYKRTRDLYGPDDPDVTAELLPVGAAAHLYDIPTIELEWAWYYRRIEFRIVDGLVFLPRKAVKEFADRRAATNA